MLSSKDYIEKLRRIEHEEETLARSAVDLESMLPQDAQIFRDEGKRRADFLFAKIRGLGSTRKAIDPVLMRHDVEIEHQTRIAYAHAQGHYFDVPEVFGVSNPVSCTFCQSSMRILFPSQDRGRCTCGGTGFIEVFVRHHESGRVYTAVEPCECHPMHSQVWVNENRAAEARSHHARLRKITEDEYRRRMEPMESVPVPLLQEGETAPPLLSPPSQPKSTPAPVAVQDVEPDDAELFDGDPPEGIDPEDVGF